MTAVTALAALAARALVFAVRDTPGDVGHRSKLDLIRQKGKKTATRRTIANIVKRIPEHADHGERGKQDHRVNPEI